MNKKKLPKAIRRAAGAPQDVASPTIIEHSGIAFRVQPQDPHGWASPDVEKAFVSPDKLSPMARQTSISKLDRARQVAASSVIERYAAYSAGGGIIPLPIASVASVTAINIRMVKLLSNLYGVSFERDRIRAIVIGLAGGVLPTGLAGTAAAMLNFLAPTNAVIALAVSSVSAAVFTRSVGRFFVLHFENGTSPYDASAADNNEMRHQAAAGFAK
jgi:uncharacterized protein (DUF697 family)